MDVAEPLKGIIYYSDCRIKEPINSIVKELIKRAKLPIVSATLKPIEFGKNIVVESSPGPFIMLWQIFMALANSESEYVFFCEHDVLYPLSHFEFTPPKNDIFYYNDHVWRWDYPTDRVITYNRLFSLSSLCVNRKFALEHYEKRLAKAITSHWYEDSSRDPEWARVIGFEPGTKKKKRGGFSDDDYETWKSRDPIVDIRHNDTFSRPKVSLNEFKHLPVNWKETTLDNIEGWDLKSMFHI